MLNNDSSLAYCGRGGAKPVLIGTAWVSEHWVCDGYVAAQGRQSKAGPAPARMTKESESEADKA